jgi:hypothetical protein
MNRKVFLAGLSFAMVVGLVGGYYYLRRPGRVGRSLQVMQFLNDPGKHPEWKVQAGQRCPNAPFQQPSDGFIGFLWGDSFSPGHRHQGLDIFAGTDPGLTPVYAAYPGYLSRMADWKSSLIIRIPEDPLQPGRQIWTYYTHMAAPSGTSYISSQFPQGTTEVFVDAGTLLGYQGNFSGDPGNPVGVHLHFSIVQDNGSGRFRNELEIANTLDPSPYFAMDLNANTNPDSLPVCQP